MSSDTIDLESAISEIIASNERIQKFWTEEASGWSPTATADMLENSSMDRLVSLSHSLRLWTDPCADEDREGRLILAWANLGILVEGSMTWFLCVFESDYAKQPMKTRTGFDLRPNRLRFEEMCRFFSEHVWIDSQRAEWDDWLAKVRSFRNAVHAFIHRDIGNWNDRQDAVVRYHAFIGELDGRVPYPEATDYYA